MISACILAITPRILKNMTRTAMACIVAFALLAACTSDPEIKPQATLASPAEFEWERMTPQEAGFDPKRFQRVIDETREHRSACLVVVKDGKLIVEKYWRGETPETSRPVFSVTKSVASTLVGLAQDDGDLTIDDRASKYIPQWRDGPSETVTIRNILANDSGRQWDPDLDYRRLFLIENRSEFAIGLGQMAEPGKVWAYNNAAIQSLDRILHDATGKRPYEMARDRIFQPLGMKHTRITNDAAAQSSDVAGGMVSTCLDMARFGMLFEQRGNWQGQQIVPEAWVEEATGAPSQKLNAAYGYLWWLNRVGDIREPIDPGSSLPPVVQPEKQMAPGAPEDMYAAVGFGGQVVLVDPGSRTIVVRLGEPNVEGRLSTYEFADAARVVTYALK